MKNGEDLTLVEKRLGTMEHYFADAMVTDYDDLVPTMTNDEKKRHVLAAAVRGGAEVLVTSNTEHFPADSVEPFDLEVVHPDDFLLDQFDLYHAPTLCALVELVEGYDFPAMTVDDFLLAFTRAGVPKFAAAERAALLNPTSEDCQGGLLAVVTARARRHRPVVRWSASGVVELCGARLPLGQGTLGARRRHWQPR